MLAAIDFGDECDSYFVQITKFDAVQGTEHYKGFLVH
jgi:hypothetical protein